MGFNYSVSIKSQSDRSNAPFRLTIELQDVAAVKDETVVLDGVAYPKVAGFTAKAETEMRPGQLLLLRGLAFDGNAVADDASPLYVVKVSTPSQFKVSSGGNIVEATPSVAPQTIAMVEAKVLITDAKRWKAAELQPLFRTLELPELAAGQVGHCVRPADSQSVLMLPGVTRIGLTSTAVTKALLPLGGDTAALGSRPMPPAEPQTADNDSHVPADNTTRRQHGMLIAFESVSEEGAVLRYAIKKHWPTSSEASPTHEIAAEGTVTLRAGETHFCRTTIRRLQADKDADAPTDAIFLLRLEGVEGTPLHAAGPRQLK